jgi:hypothetical protein
MTRTHGRLAVVPGLLVLLALSPGCGPSTATVAGKVAYQGKPVVWGSVSLRASDGSYHQIGINPDGTYHLDKVPVGPASVGVSSPDPAPSPRLKRGEGSDQKVNAPPPPPPPGAWVPLPAKYVDAATSGVTIEVGSGSADIDLK